ncbi:MAG: hypothetical protein OER97_07185 [Gammaproteobacteria bacterium]|nr:hypothetical protein [Gammaproteobacteria bacterium]
MTDPMLQTGLYLLAAAVAGGLIGWLIRTGYSSRGLNKMSDAWQIKFDEAVRQRDRFNAENTTLRTSIEAQQALVHRHEMAANKSRSDLESVRVKTESLSKELFTRNSERDELKDQVNKSQSALNMANHQIAELEGEFNKAGAFYKGELEKAFDKRKSLELKIDDAKLEHESLRNLLEATKSEHASVNKMLTSAKARLSNLDALEQKSIVLEAENAQLRHDAALTKQEIEGLQRNVAELDKLQVQNDALEQKSNELKADNAKLRHDSALTKQQIEGLQRGVTELDELKVQNRELAHCLESMEESRRQYEVDAKRYRKQADNSEKKSETMRVRLDNIEQNFADMEKQHDKAVMKARKQDVVKQSNGHAAPIPEVDDLTEIVGIGKAFQHILHELGVVNFRQIAAFGPADVARVNMELKEYKGRMEQDDWIGQAKELHFKKYGNASDH